MTAQRPNSPFPLDSSGTGTWPGVCQYRNNKVNFFAVQLSRPRQRDCTKKVQICSSKELMVCGGGWKVTKRTYNQCHWFWLILILFIFLV